MISTEIHLSTPDLCDQYSDWVSVVEPVFINYGGRQKFGGQIITIKCFEDNSRIKEMVALAGHGRVIVVDGGGSLRCAYLGDGLAAQAVENGWGGLIIYGCIRDVDEIRAMDIGVQALASHPRKTNRKGAGDVGINVTLGGTTFRPGAYVYADNNGVIVATKKLL